MKKKPRFLVDEDTRYILDMFDWGTSIANFATFEDADLKYYAEDEEVLSAGQRLGRIVLTKDGGGGYSRRKVFSPTFSRTGVVVVKDSRPDEVPTVVIRLSKAISHDDLVHARTEANLTIAKIAKSNTGYIVDLEEQAK